MEKEVDTETLAGMDMEERRVVAMVMA